MNIIKGDIRKIGSTIESITKITKEKRQVSFLYSYYINMGAIENTLNWIKQSAESIIKDVDSVKTCEKVSPWQKVWVVYWLDEVWVLDRDTLRTYANREDAYKYYRELALCTLEWYKKYSKWILTDFKESTYFTDGTNTDFGVDNIKGWRCHIWYGYEECVLEESFIL